MAQIIDGVLKAVQPYIVELAVALATGGVAWVRAWAQRKLIGSHAEVAAARVADPEDEMGSEAAVEHVVQVVSKAPAAIRPLLDPRGTVERAVLEAVAKAKSDPPPPS